MFKFDYDSKIATADSLKNMGFESNDNPFKKDFVLQSILTKNTFLFNRHVVIAQFDNKYHIVRGFAFVNSFLYLVKYIKEENLKSSEQRQVREYDFTYNFVFLQNEEELNELKRTLEQCSGF